MYFICIHGYKETFSRDNLRNIYLNTLLWTDVCSLLSCRDMFAISTTSEKYGSCTASEKRLLHARRQRNVCCMRGGRETYVACNFGGLYCVECRKIPSVSGPQSGARTPPPSSPGDLDHDMNPDSGVPS